jgi:uncharacterized membrane protein YkgB
MEIKKIDEEIINAIKKVSLPLSRFAIFVVYFWFGILKVLGTSPANPIVMQLQQATLPFLSFQQFIIIFGLFEMLIGILFLIRGYERLAIALLVMHLITTILPLLVLPQVTWQGFMTPTLEGQYIIKNILIIATAIGIAAHTHMRPMK